MNNTGNYFILLFEGIFENEERIYNLFGFTHDGDPTMEGDINSMKTKLLELNPRLWSIWDAAH